MDKKRTLPPKIDHLLTVIKNCIDTGYYRSRNHANERSVERHINLNDIKHVLKNGRHEAAKDEFSETHRTWKYAIRGKSKDDDDIRVIVAFDGDIMWIITVINLNND